MNRDHATFTVGGEREKVYNFLRDHGFVMSGWSDKRWTRADGIELQVYGGGSMGRIHSTNGELLVDAPLAAAVATVAKAKS